MTDCLPDIPRGTWEQQKPPGTFALHGTHYVVSNVFKVDKQFTVVMLYLCLFIKAVLYKRYLSRSDTQLPHQHV